MDPRVFHKRGFHAASEFFHDFRDKMNEKADSLWRMVKERQTAIMTTMVAMWAYASPAELTTHVFKRDMNVWILSHNDTFLKSDS